MALHKFESLSNDKRESARQALIAYMSWRNPETIQAYDHHLAQMHFAPTHAALARLIEGGETHVCYIASFTWGHIIGSADHYRSRAEWLEQLLKEDKSK